MAKIPEDMVEELRAAIDSLMSEKVMEDLRDRYRFPRAENTKDVDRRFRWDLLWSTPEAFRRAWFDRAYRELDANDAHIDTALRKVVTPLGAK